ncbi:hypothetical protein E2C01_051092 [Portunus trituberculatus]|uniref:CENPB DNA-binding domain-containing protein 1 n=1 Tax=Portunus trituberculatus TaxID=210409 RepID=A0A5B7GJ95_PORTR|nr:hypothetical protein [Portunus trituberculatus]
MMSSKWSTTPTAGELKAKRQRKTLSLEKMLETVQFYEGPECANFIARTLQLSQSLVSIIMKQAASVKKTGETASTLVAKKLMRKREPMHTNGRKA